MLQLEEKVQAMDQGYKGFSVRLRLFRRKVYLV
jgi:hypothetical protein